MRSQMDAILVHIIARVASFLPPNEVAATLRLVCKAFAQLLSSYVHVRLSHPVPHHAFLWRWCSDTAMRPLPLRQRLRLVCLVAASGCLDNLQAALTAAGLAPDAQEDLRDVGRRRRPYEPMTVAAEAGQLHVCQWLWGRGFIFQNTLAAAARAGHQHVCRWALKELFLLEAGFAARGGHMELAQEHTTRKTDTMLVGYFLAGVAYSCNLGTLQQEFQKWMDGQGLHHRHGQAQGGLLAPVILDPWSWEWRHVIAAAAGSPTPDWQEKVAWLEAQGNMRRDLCNHEVLEAAAKCSNAADRLDWLRQRGYDVSGWGAVEGAAHAGNTAVLEGLLSEGMGPDDGRLAQEMAWEGDLATLKVLHRRGWMWNIWRTPSYALRGGHLEMVKWMEEEAGVILDMESSLNPAIRSGNLELVEWLLELEFDWDGATLSEAAACGCVAMLERLVEQGCPVPNDSSPYVVAAHNGDLATLACLHRLGVPLGPASAQTFAKSVHEGDRSAPLSTLRWLLAAGCPVDVQEVEKRLGERYDEPEMWEMFRMQLGWGGAAIGGVSEASAAAIRARGLRAGPGMRL